MGDGRLDVHNLQVHKIKTRQRMGKEKQRAEMDGVLSAALGLGCADANVSVEMPEKVLSTV
jgi:hypothetical protein